MESYADYIDQSVPMREKTENVNIFNLSIREQLQILWGWFWRSAIVSLIAMAISFIVAFIYGFFMSIALLLMGIDVQEHMLLFQLSGGFIGLLIGFFSLAYLLRWLTTASFGKYRFCLLKTLP